ncbi:Uu.00g088540.m01.CDS01 [Anthostomella pinea]|uniref:Uu.00g088540.m01.CDS01 n=1 Tax=Anthostomella pinea TaxID=933095 RepID=A0AAI8YK82_9PEZI|nr:Uu.00g088540.m01.CDS01 [Anthostomella pinea]
MSSTGTASTHDLVPADDVEDIRNMLVLGTSGQRGVVMTFVRVVGLPAQRRATR